MFSKLEDHWTGGTTLFTTDEGAPPAAGDINVANDMCNQFKAPVSQSTLHVAHWVKSVNESTSNDRPKLFWTNSCDLYIPVYMFGPSTGMKFLQPAKMPTCIRIQVSWKINMNIVTELQMLLAVLKTSFMQLVVEIWEVNWAFVCIIQAVVPIIFAA